MKNLTLLKILLISIFSISNTNLVSQVYSYQDYLIDKQLEVKLRKNINNNEFDSLKLNFSSYKNKLGFLGYEIKSLIDTNKLNRLRYLDTSFMRGLTPLCLPKPYRDFDTLIVNQSFRKNYLKSFNIRLINIIDSIHYRDQYYRQLIALENKKKLDINVKKSDKSLILLNNNYKTKIKNYETLQDKTDSSNFVKLNETVKIYGWPSANKIGVYYCQRPAADITTILSNINDSKIDYLINQMYKVIDLCENHEESWQVPEWLINKVNQRYRDNFHEFLYLIISENKLDTSKSFFSIYNMSINLMCHPSEKIILKCTNRILFENIKNEMFKISKNHEFDKTYINDLKSVHYPIPAKISESSIEYIEDKNIGQNKVYYKFSLK